MKTFKQFLDKPSEKFLDLPSFAEIRHLKPKPKPLDILDLPAFSEIRHQNKNLQKESQERPIEAASDNHAEFHNHPDIKPRRPLDPEEVSHVKGYTSARSASPYRGFKSSLVMNNQLRIKAGQELLNPFHRQHDEAKVDEAINNLSGTIRHSDITNRKPVRVYAGIPREISTKIHGLKVGEQLLIPGFSSTSSDKKVAERFSRQYGGPSPLYAHVLNLHCEPGSGMSVAHDENLTDYPLEKEFLLDHGATFEKTKESEHDNGTWIHHGRIIPRPLA